MNKREKKLREFVAKWMKLYPCHGQEECCCHLRCASELKDLLRAIPETAVRPNVVGASPICLDCNKVGLRNCQHFDECDGTWVYKPETALQCEFIISLVGRCVLPLGHKGLHRSEKAVLSEEQEYYNYYVVCPKCGREGRLDTFAYYKNKPGPAKPAQGSEYDQCHSNAKFCETCGVCHIDAVKENCPNAKPAIGENK